jgi:hypothetical protein
MKILFIGSKKFDYLQDLTYTGLVKSFGINSVIEANWVIKKHLDYYQYPKNIAYIKGSFFQTLFTSFRKDYDLVIVASAKCDTFESYKKILPTIPSITPIIFIDGGDREEVGGDLDRGGCDSLYHDVISQRPFDIIFKREMIIDKTYESNIYALPLSFNLDKLPPLDHNLIYDVTFWAGNNHPTRSRTFALLDGAFDCNSNGTINDIKSIKGFDRKGDLYLQELARSKIALNFRGGGWDTLRFWEIPAVARLMVSGRPGIIIPHNFEHEKHTIYTRDDQNDLIELLEYYLSHETQRETIAKAGRAHLEAYHTDRARIEYMANTLLSNGISL